MKSLNLLNRTITTENGAFVMGILNATPDSFYENSRGGVERAKKMIDEGADIIDIGGESSRPNSKYIDVEEEIKRVVPIVKEIRKFSDIPISIDTRKYQVFKAAYEQGADIANDISACEDDENLLNFVSEKSLPLILMHKRGNPDIMQQDTKYFDVFEEVNEYLKKRCEFVFSKGVNQDKIIIDPGIGFAKDEKSNIELIKKCGNLCNAKYPVLMGLSRKSFLGKITRRDTNDLLASTIVANILCVQNGASIIRVHDVKEAVDSLKILKRVSDEYV